MLMGDELEGQEGIRRLAGWPRSGNCAKLGGVRLVKESYKTRGMEVLREVVL